MSLRDLEIRKYTAPIEKELNKQKEKNGLQKNEIKLLREALREAIGGLKVFPNAYPNGEWKMRLHEEDCVGTRLLPEERDESDVCRCDGDHDAAYILECIEKAERLVSPKKDLKPIREEATDAELAESLAKIEKMS